MPHETLLFPNPKRVWLLAYRRKEAQALLLLRHFFAAFSRRECRSLLTAPGCLSRVTLSSSMEEKKELAIVPRFLSRRAEQAEATVTEYYARKH